MCIYTGRISVKCSKYVIGKYCLKYETGTANKNSGSSGTAEVKVTFFSDASCQVLFSLSGDKENGGANKVCNNVPNACAAPNDYPQHVQIRQQSEDGWNIKKLQIQSYPGSSNFIAYSPDGEFPEFWVDGNEDSYSCTDGSCKSCTNGADDIWCDLKDLKGTSFDIIPRAYIIFIILYFFPLGYAFSILFS